MSQAKVLVFLVGNKGIDRENYYNNYIGTYLDRDFKEVSGAVDTHKFYNFLIAAAGLAANLVNRKTIAAKCGIDQSIVKKWLEILETIGVIFFLQPYRSDTLKRVIRTPKLYFYDSGLVAYLNKLSSHDV